MEYNKDKGKKSINQIIQNFNLTTKLLLLFFYTAILVVASILITTALDKNKYERIYEEYAEASEDENIFVNIRVDEMRSMRSEKEAAYYNFYVVIFKKPDSGEVKREIQQVQLEYDLATEGGKVRFGSTSMTYDARSTYSFSISPSPTPRKSLADEVNETPDTLYLKVMYKVSIEGQTTKQEKQLLIKEKVEDIAPATDDYALATLDSTGKVDEGYFTYKLDKRVKDNVSNYRIELKAKADNLVKHIRLHTYASINNEPTDVDNQFPDYLMLVNYYGSLNTYTSLSRFSATAINEKYNPTFAYVKADVFTYDGKVEHILFKIDLSGVPVINE